MAIETVHIAGLWLTSKCWQQTHSKAHLGTRGTDPQGREPHAQPSIPPKLSQELQGEATLFVFSYLDQNTIENRVAGVPQADASTILLNLNTSLLR